MKTWIIAIAVFLSLVVYGYKLFRFDDDHKSFKFKVLSTETVQTFDDERAVAILQFNQDTFIKTITYKFSVTDNIKKGEIIDGFVLNTSGKVSIGNRYIVAFMESYIIVTIVFFITLLILNIIKRLN